MRIHTGVCVRIYAKTASNTLVEQSVWTGCTDAGGQGGYVGSVGTNAYANANNTGQRRRNQKRALDVCKSSSQVVKL